METIAKTVQVLSVVIGVVISVLSFNATRDNELQARKIEIAKPFLELRQKVYLDAVKTITMLAEPEGYYSQAELGEAKRRFRALYVAELGMVASQEVEAQIAPTMTNLANKLDKRLLSLDESQQAARKLAYGLRDSIAAPWGVGQK